MANQEVVSQEQLRLQEELDQVQLELNRLQQLMQNEVDIEPDEGDTEIFEREKNAALMAVLDAKLQDIHAALRSIEKGNYGLCQRCGKAIEPERLEIKPDATLCISCQQEVERLARRGRPQRQIQW
jgi:DnaK suppressor protein